MPRISKYKDMRSFVRGHGVYRFEKITRREEIYRERIGSRCITWIREGESSRRRRAAGGSSDLSRVSARRRWGIGGPAALYSMCPG
jgi:hypothetical protein